MLKATVKYCPATAPASRHGGFTRLVNGHDAKCADSVLVHQPAQLDGEPVRVVVLLVRAEELFHALGGLLAAQAHAMHELLDPSLAGTDVLSLCVEPFEQQTVDRGSSPR